MRNRSFFFLLLACFFAGTPSPSRQDEVLCGTHRERAKEELHLHREALRLRPKPQLTVLAAGPRAGKDIGNIAILEDSGGVVLRRNAFDLDLRTVTFQAATGDASRYRFEIGNNSYDGEAASNGTRIGLDDDDTREFVLPFDFPFYGVARQSVFVNSDGDLTFGKGDTSTSARSLGRVTSGPARIAGLFRDLDPSQSAMGVRVLSEAGRFVVSWAQVPEFRLFGTGPLQTFQIRLFPDGRIELAYNGITTDEAIVAISPGGNQGTTETVSFREGSAQEFSAAVAEVFRASGDELDTVAAAQNFYETHEDSYDYLVFYNNLGLAPCPPFSAVACAFTVRNQATGFGDITVDTGADFGSSSRLKSIIDMGPLSQYPTDPNGRVQGRLITGDTPLTVLAHEVGHLFLAYASVRDPDNPGDRPMLGSANAHWSFNFNSDASLLEGNRIRDNGPDAVPAFTTIATVEGYSPLDQYLMGFRAPEDIDPPHELFWVANSNRSRTRPPQSGVSINGQRRDITVGEIVQAEGRRTPDHTVAQRNFRVAFILVVPQGTEPSAEEIDKLDTFRSELEAFYLRATSDRALLETSFKRSLKLSVAPAAGVVAGASIPAHVSIEAGAAAPLTVTLERKNGVVDAPASVTIPAGQTSVEFTITGLTGGVEELAARPSDEQYETRHARIQVALSIASLQVAVVAGDKQMATPGVPLPEAIVVRVVDINNLPYRDLTVQATASTGGSVTPASAVTDADGQAAFVWTPGEGPGHELKVELAGAPSTAATVIALGRPALEAAGVVNAASFTSGLAPGGFVSIFGVNLSAGDTAAAAPPFPLTLAGVRVLLNGRLAGLHFVSHGQINFVAHSDLAEGMAEVVVQTPIGSAAPVEVPVFAAAPGIFFDTATGFGAVVRSGASSITAVIPARRGDFIEIYCTGLGALRPHPTIPGLEETVLPATALLNGAPLEVVFSGQAPGFPGLYQVNARVREDAAPGDQMLALEVGGRRSNEVMVRVQ